MEAVGEQLPFSNGSGGKKSAANANGSLSSRRHSAGGGGGILARALGHTRDSSLDDGSGGAEDSTAAPAAVVVVPSSAMAQQKQANDTATISSIDKIVGASDTALRVTVPTAIVTSPQNATRRMLSPEELEGKRRISVVDSSDDDYRYGILGKSLRQFNNGQLGDHRQRQFDTETSSSSGEGPPNASGRRVLATSIVPKRKRLGFYPSGDGANLPPATAGINSAVGIDSRARSIQVAEELRRAAIEGGGGGGGGRVDTAEQAELESADGGGGGAVADDGGGGAEDGTLQARGGPGGGLTVADQEELAALELLSKGGDQGALLLLMAKQGNWEGVQQLLASGSQLDMTSSDTQGYTPLLLAVRAGFVDIVEMMLERSADLYAATKDRLTAAHICARWANEEMMQKLLALKIDISRTAGPLGRLPIHMCCERTSARALPIAQLLLHAAPGTRMQADKRGALPLHVALRVCNLLMVQLLLQRDGDKQIRVQDSDGNTAMHLCKNNDFLRAITDHGGTECVNVQNAFGRTPLHEVAKLGDDKMLKIMWKLNANANIMDKEEKTPLHVAAERGHTQVVETLIDKFGSSIRARTFDGSTLLHIASAAGHADTALAFLKRGVPLYMPNKSGALSLHAAAAAGYNDVVKMLIARGTKVDITTRDTYTALTVAVRSGQASVVETLLGFGADVHVKGGQIGETALHVAAGLPCGSIDCAQMLLKSGAQPNVQRAQDGCTPLHIAAAVGNRAICRLLLVEGADAHLKSKNGETALHLASKQCHFAIVQLLLEHLTKDSDSNRVRNYVNALTEDGQTCLHYASQIAPEQIHFKDEDAKIVSLLIDNGGDPELQGLNNLETAMHMCARSGNESILSAMVNKIGPGAVQIVQNKKSKNGWSPLLEACARGHVGVSRILLQHHARIDVFDDAGRTALHLASANGHIELTKLLLKYKAFVNSKAKNGEAPLHLAAQYGHARVVNMLVQEHGASLEAITLDNQTALHFSAKYGQLVVAQTLLALGANPNARDDKGQTPLHLAAENDFPDVVKLFLKMKQNNHAVLTAVDHSGFTCAHIAAMKGSLAVVKELMMIDKAMVIHAKTKTLEATTLHMAAGGGHAKIVKILLENGANPEDENANGMTPLSLAAWNGHSGILPCFERKYWRRCSKKTGLNAFHIAAYKGHSDFINEMIKCVPASVRSEPPMFNHLVMKEFATEYGFTPLHLAAQAGHDTLVRMLLNQGVQVDAATTTMNVIALHLAAQQGHIAVVGMLLSRSTQQQHAKDWRGRTPLHLASVNGKKDMVSLLIAQGSNINVMDQNGWTGMHFATKAGHIDVVKLFVMSSADAQAETKDGKVPLCFAAANNHIECLRFLLKQKHDTHQLMEDRKFIFDLMVCGKGNDNQPLQEFILHSPAPIDTAVKLSSLYREMSEKEKERAKDLSNVAIFAENLAVELLGISATKYNAALLLKAKDHRGRPLLDVLIENEQKEVVSYASVQRYLTEIWTGRVDWSFGKTVAFAFFVLVCPPAWFYFSLPLDSRIGRAPIIKFVCHIVSHVYFTILLTIVVLNITHKIYEMTSVVPNWVEWLLLLWLSGNLVSELSNVGGGSGLGVVKILILVLAAIAIAVHILAFLLPAIYLTHLDNDEKLHFARTMLYLKNQLLAFALLFAFVEFLDFLTVHHLFGPWAIIIRDLMYDLTRFLVILMLFVAGFTLHVTSIFQPAYQPVDEDSAELMRLASPSQTLEMLFFSLFGLVEPDSMPPLHLVPDFAKIVLKFLFGIYMMVTLIVLINLLIAMMSDTYQRIQAQSDKEWKFGRAILIRQMNKRSATPSPINMLTKCYIVLKVAWRNKLHFCTQKAQQDLRLLANPKR
uniref:Ion transport domain-containing protein n=1 Tax=Globodera rostochiensis TaxID=31243 RepID=A0A914GWL2_GLORO